MFSEAQRKSRCLPVWENVLDPGRHKAYPDPLPAPCVLLFGKIEFNECKAETPTWATVTRASPTCRLARSVTQTEAPGTCKMGIWIFPYGRLAVNWLGHKLSVGLTLGNFTLGNFTFLRSFLAKATSRLKIHLPVFLLTSLLGQLSGAGLNFCAVHSRFLLFLIRNLFCIEISCFKNNDKKQKEVIWDWRNLQLFNMTTEVLSKSRKCLLGLSFRNWWETLRFLIASKCEIWKVLPLKWSGY